MKRTSLDGRSRKSHQSTSKPKKKTQSDLKPASPPKSSPWGHFDSISTKSTDEFPALPLAKSGIEEADESTGSEGKERQNPINEEAGVASSGELQEAASSDAYNSASEDSQTPIIEEPPSASDEETRTPTGEDAPSLVSEEAQTVLEGSQSPASSISATTMEDKASPNQNKDRVSDSVSTCSSESRKLFEAAASRATENLWNYCIGADVHIYVDSLVYKVHRNVLVQHSAWLREFLPPPNEDGTPIDVYLPFAVGAVGPCLSFMYTNRIDICERDDTSPLSSVHLARCVLGYCGAATLQMSALSAHIIRIVESTAGEFAGYFATHFVNQEMNRKQGYDFAYHLTSAFNIIHSEPCYELVRPMRLALARVFDEIFPSLFRQPAFVYMLGLPSWKQHSAAISADLLEYRRLVGYSRHTKGVIPSTKDEFEVLYGKWSTRNNKQQLVGNNESEREAKNE
ncbi:hypothetical protein PT974_09192 [Cladobotryum mycophilum]|uniref:BTB domain-containing protein n=1 Tax=Cladobotryum mycophilum TaxID=491253 RepID=A0ABR0SGI2_9HYPO